MKIEKIRVHPDDGDSQQMLIDNLILALGSLNFKEGSLFDWMDHADYWDLYLCYNETHDIIAFGILAYGNGHNFYDLHISSAKCVLTHLQVKASERHKGIGTYLMEYIKNDTPDNIFLLSIKDTYMFYMSCGAYVLSNDFVEDSCIMVIPGHNYPYDIYTSSYDTIYTFMLRLLDKDLELSFIQSSAHTTQFYIDEYFCKTCKIWKKYHEESDEICGCLCVI